MAEAGSARRLAEGFGSAAYTTWMQITNFKFLARASEIAVRHSSRKEKESYAAWMGKQAASGGS